MNQIPEHRVPAIDPGKAEVNLAQLEEVSGGPHLVTLDGQKYDLQSLGQEMRLPLGSARFNRI